jgi:UDP-N-acetyl-D-glucosamine dehydrogenase
VGVDLFEVVSAIRQRPTHANIRQPGFGVGGYCLTKDPLMAGAAARELFGVDTLHFPFSEAAVRTNAEAPLTSVRRLEVLLGGLAGRSILLLGVAYRQDVSDTRFSPSELFVREAEALGAEVHCHDPLVAYWPELTRDVAQQLPVPEVDAVVLAVPHGEYRTLDVPAWVGAHRPLLFDANAVLSAVQQRACVSLGLPLWIVGRGLLSHGTR